jgi:hypothetical protein
MRAARTTAAAAAAGHRSILAQLGRHGLPRLLQDVLQLPREAPVGRLRPPHKPLVNVFPCLPSLCLPSSTCSECRAGAQPDQSRGVIMACGCCTRTLLIQNVHSYAATQLGSNGALPARRLGARAGGAP